MTWEEQFEKKIMCYCEGGKISNHTTSNPEIIKQFISDLLMEEQNKWHKAGWEDCSKEWLSCLPEELDENSPYFSNRELKHHTGFNHARIKFLENAKAKKLIE